MPEYTYKIRVSDFSYAHKYMAYLYANGKEIDHEFCMTVWGAKLWLKLAKRKHKNRVPRTVKEGKL